MDARDHILRSAALRGQGDFKAAIDEIETNRSKFDDISLLPALLQALYAAHERNDYAVARGYVDEILKIDPHIPNINHYLS